MSMRRTLPLLLLLALPAAADSPAAGDSDAQRLRQLMQSLAGVSQIEASFRDEKHSGMLQFPLVTKGQFEYRAPDFISRRVSTPKPSLFEVDGDQLRLQRDGEVTLVDTRDQPILAELLRAIRAILGGDLAWLQTRFTVTMSTDGQHWTLQLKPTDAQLSQYLELLEVAGVGRQIRTLGLYESSGDHTDTLFSNHRIR